MLQLTHTFYRVFVPFAVAILMLGLSLILWLGQAPQPAQAISTTIVISEFRTRGPNGASDEFVELFNRTDQPIDISGWKIRRSGTGSGTVDWMVITAATFIPARGYFLAANVSYSGAITPTQTFTNNLPNSGGLAVTLANNTVIDAVGTVLTTTYREGTPLPPLSSNTDQSYIRLPGGLAGSDQDTDNNFSDFVLGASDPQNQDSAPACYQNRTVSNLANSGPGTLREALGQICPGGTVNFAPGLANQAIILTSELAITKSVIITNPNAPNLRLSGNNTNRIFNIQGTPVTIANLNFISGTVLGSGCPQFCGGAIVVNNGVNVTIHNSTFTGNLASTRAGAIYNQGNLTLNNSTLSLNGANRGGAIYNTSNAILVINNSTLSSNGANTTGGSIHSQGTVTINSSTLSGNQSNQEGGALYLEANRTVTITYSTLSNNRATTSGGGIHNFGNLRLRNTIIANSVSGGDCTLAGTGAILTNINNLIEDGSCNNNATGFVSGDPNLGPLQNNGGSTLTHALRKPSPAINAGESTNAPPFDQRGPGFSRILENVIDIGAVEFSPPCNITVTDAADNGPDTLRQALVDVCNGGTIDFAPSLANQVINLTTTELLITKTVTITNPNAPNLKISGNQTHRIFNLQGGSVLTLGFLNLISGTTASGVGCPAFCGGAILVNSGTTLTVNNSAFNGNSTSNQGGGIFNQGFLTLNNTFFNSSFASNAGGGLGNLGTATINYSLFKNNSANQGGGIHNQMVLTVNNSTFDQNLAQDAGGGIYNQLSLAVNSSTLSGNISNNLGGGIYNRSSLDLKNSTLSANSATRGGGGIRNLGTLNFRNTIIANSPVGGDCVTSGGGAIGVNVANLVENGSCSAVRSGDPNLGPLQDNGGPTPTHALLRLSPAINNGNNTNVPNFDQRGPGFPRIIDGTVDIGAIEFVQKPGLYINPISLILSEAGQPGAYGLGLLSQPSAPVALSIATDAQVVVTPTVLYFDSLNWEQAQTVTVEAVDDSAIEGAHSSLLQHTISSSDSVYANITGTVTIFINDNDPVVAPKPSIVYLPVLANDFGQAPDLIVESVVATGDNVTLVIKNIGDAPVTDDFWVDVYLNPSSAPTQVNQVWQGLSSQGLVWGVTQIIPVGGSLTLTIKDAYYRPDYSVFDGIIPPDTLVYAQVDSVNLTTNYGGVLEGHEVNSGTYNNITGPVLASANLGGVSTPATNVTPSTTSADQLPAR
jgi:hypothetical protein